MIVPPPFLIGLDDSQKRHIDNVILISGQSGSGKTTIGNKLSNFDDVIVYDTDDVNFDTRNELKSNSEYNEAIDTGNNETSNRMQNTLARKKRDIIINENKNKVIVFVGVTMSFDDIECDKYYIDLDIEEHYKRLSLRTLEEICSNANQIQEIINNVKPRKSLVDIINLGVKQRFPIDFDKMKSIVENSRKFAEESGYKVMTSKDILREIISEYNLKESTEAIADSDSIDTVHSSEIQQIAGSNYRHKYQKYKAKYIAERTRNNIS
jgi:shikimate kinase